MLIKFEKMHGCGNDFIIIDNTKSNIKLNSPTIENLCKWHYGIGADGLVLIDKNGPDYFMHYYSADGSQAELGANVMRCVGDFISRNLEPERKEFSVDSIPGKVPVRINDDKSVSIELKPVSFEPEDIGLNNGYEPMAEGITRMSFGEKTVYPVGVASMGNSHCIVIVKDFLTVPMGKLGPLIEKSRVFKTAVNATFVQVLSDDLIKAMTWERGLGFTLACGSGACAAASFLYKNRFLNNNEITVLMPGGEILLKLEEDKIIMTGPAEKVFAGEIEVNNE